MTPNDDSRPAAETPPKLAERWESTCWSVFSIGVVAVLMGLTIAAVNTMPLGVEAQKVLSYTLLPFARSAIVLVAWLTFFLAARNTFLAAKGFDERREAIGRHIRTGSGKAMKSESGSLSEPFPEARPRVITDAGPQFVAKDFKELIRVSGMTPGTPLCVDDARRLVERHVHHYNTERLHSTLGYVTPQDKLNGKEDDIFIFRESKLKEAREARRQRREAARVPTESSEAPKSDANDDTSAVSSDTTEVSPRQRFDDFRALRNDVKIIEVAAELGIPAKNRGERMRVSRRASA